MLQSSTEEGSQNMSSRGDPLASNSRARPEPVQRFLRLLTASFTRELVKVLGNRSIDPIDVES